MAGNRVMHLYLNHTSLDLVEEIIGEVYLSQVEDRGENRLVT